MLEWLPVVLSLQY